MSHLLHRFVISLVAFAFTVTSIGWGVAGALEGLSPHHESEIALTAVLSADHADRTAQLDPSCSADKDCADNAGPDHKQLADKCCATACHIAMQASVCDHGFFPVVSSLGGVSPDDDIKEAVSARLERPPRLITA